MATIGSIRDRVITRLERDGISIPTDESDLILTWVNEIRTHEFAARHNWESMDYVQTDAEAESCVADQEQYDLETLLTNATYPGSRLKDVVMVLFRRSSTDNFWPMRELRTSQVLWGLPITTTSSEPFAWYRMARRKIGFRPVPSSSSFEFKVYGWYYPETLTSGENDYFTDSHGDLLEDLAAARALGLYGEAEKGAALRAEALERLSQRIRDDKRKIGKAQTTISVSRFAGVPESEAAWFRHGDLGIYRRY